MDGLFLHEIRELKGKGKKRKKTDREKGSKMVGFPSILSFLLVYDSKGLRDLELSLSSSSLSLLTSVSCGE